MLTYFRGRGQSPVLFTQSAVEAVLHQAGSVQVEQLSVVPTGPLFSARTTSIHPPTYKQLRSGDSVGISCLELKTAS